MALVVTPRPLSQRAELYQRQRMSLSHARYAWIDSRFALPNAPVANPAASHSWYVPLKLFSTPASVRCASEWACVVRNVSSVAPAGNGGARWSGGTSTVDMK